MPRFVALLRGVNVGKANRVPMAEFRSMLEELGYSQVATLLNSGSAVFSSSGRATAKHESGIAAALQQKLGVVTPVVVKSEAQVKAAIAGAAPAPPESEWSRFLVAFGPNQAALQGLRSIAPLVQESERFSIGEAAAYLHCPEGLLASKAGAALVGKVGTSVTTRNWATVLKLQALLSAA